MYTLALLIALLLARAAHADDSAMPRHPTDAQLPPLMLWVWERPCDLTAIDPREVGVAFLACTVRLDDTGLSVLPRLQPFAVPPGTPLVAVARIETDPHRPPRLSTALAKSVAAPIADLAMLPGLAALQVDFDASLSERSFYRALLQALRRRIPARTPLSITALASWCLDDRWLEGLPVDDAVPMLFRMGRDDATIRARLAAGEDFDEPLCRSSVGVADDEPAPRLPEGRRRYLFLARGCSDAATPGAHLPRMIAR